MSQFDEIRVFECSTHHDFRGFFSETWNLSRYSEMGLRKHFVQDNVSWSRHGVLRGLHLQSPRSQGKLVHVLSGVVFDVAVDARFGSPMFGKWFGLELSDRNGRQVYIPPGFAHGFCVLSNSALVSYKCTTSYDRDAEISILWNDPTIGIAWPIQGPTLSEKDAAALRLNDIPIMRFPKWNDVHGVVTNSSTRRRHRSRINGQRTGDEY